MPVLEGDTILVPIADLDKQKEHPVDVTWNQSLTATSEKYIQTTFTITTTKDERKTGAETEGVIFVQLSMFDSFEAKAVAGQPELTIVIDKDFMYGQKSKDGRCRWLVYHNKKHKPFQHRFIEATIKSGLDKASNIPKMLGIESGDGLDKDVVDLIGDHLHPFKGDGKGEV